MPLTFEEAKLQVNPDPLFQPLRGSAEYKEILAVMRQSGEQFLDNLQTAKPPLTAADVYVNNAYKNPINNPRPLPGKKSISKAEFLSLSSHKKAFANVLTSRSALSVAPSTKIIVTREMLANLKTAVAAKVTKGPQPKMSKQEFLTMADNREYMRLHSLLTDNNK